MGSFQSCNGEGRAWRVGTAFAALFTLIGNVTPASAQLQQLVIHRVFVDFNAQEIVIVGENFDNGGDPVVTLGNETRQRVMESPEPRGG